VLELWTRAAVGPGATDDAEALRALLSSDPEALLVAEAEGRLVGALIIAWDGWRANMYRLSVPPRTASSLPLPAHCDSRRPVGVQPYCQP
jgi:ribosomal protein S18 acetylase RimI-like enzyme